MKASGETEMFANFFRGECWFAFVASASFQQIKVVFQIFHLLAQRTDLFEHGFLVPFQNRFLRWRANHKHLSGYRLFVSQFYHRSHRIKPDNRPCATEIPRRHFAIALCFHAALVQAAELYGGFGRPRVAEANANSPGQTRHILLCNGHLP